MGRKLNNLIGLSFGLLSVARQAESKDGRVYWLCKCSCGAEKVVRGEHLVSGRTRSCGCSTRKFTRTKIEKQHSLVNQRFGRLFVLWRAESRVYGTQGRMYTPWECKCDCGNLVKVATGSLRSGKTKSCGCLFRDIVRLGPGQAGFNMLLDRYKKQADERKLKWELTDEQFKSLTLGNCYYCGEPPKQVSRRHSDSGAFVYNGVDRLNSLLGYISGNVASCCFVCNSMKRVMSPEAFITHLRKVLNRWDNKNAQEVGIYG